MLTQKQLDLLRFIHGRVAKDGVSPSFDEMKEALNLRSKSGIHRLITALEERGFIRRLAHRARAIEIIKLPDGIEQGRMPMAAPRRAPGSSDGAKGEDADNVVRADFGRRDSAPTTAADLATVPFVGRVAAGLPIEALNHSGDQIPVPPSMLSPHGEHYALEVKGDSMIDLGIHEGDIVVVKRQDVANDGDIVVALVEDHEATLKTLRRKSDIVELEPANAAYETQRYHAEQVRVQGRLVGLIRTY